MKKMACLMALIMALLLSVALADRDVIADVGDPIYRARITKDTRIRNEQDMKSRDWLGKVPAGKMVDVYEYGETWCLCGYGGDIGFLPTDRLYEMWRLSDVQLPGFIPMKGLAVMECEAVVSVEGYQANRLEPGDVIVAADEKGMIPMYRSTAQLPEGSFRFIPFVPWEKAAPGDVLYGYTTWYEINEKKRLIVGRVENIETGVERVSGTVIQPGEEFSFNELSGPYTYGNGYQMAPNVSASGVGVGGGVCQVSTTIFQTIQGLDVELTEWYVHSYAGVKYARRNHDSAVGRWKDFRFINRHEFPIELTLWAEDGVLTCLISRSDK